MSDFFESLPREDPDLPGFLLASVAESTLPPAERGQMGVVYTDAALAGFTIDEGLRALGRVPVRVLDPACGGGAFLAEASLRLRWSDSSLTGLDPDRVALEAARARLALIAGRGRSSCRAAVDGSHHVQEGRLRVSLKSVDALAHAPGRGFDLVIGNPPYVRQEALGGAAAKQRLAARFEKMLAGAGSVLGGKADLSVAFLLLGLAHLRVGGVLAYVTTNAWLDTLYGAPLRRFLAERAEVGLVAEWDGKAFAGAAVNPVVVVIRRSDRPARRATTFASFSRARGRTDSPMGAREGAGWKSRSRRVKPAELASESPWGTALLRRTDVLEEAVRNARRAFAPLGEIASLHYGTKPGLIDFFVLEAAELEVEDRFLRPVLTSTSEMETLRVRARDLSRRLFVCPLTFGDLLRGRYFSAATHVRRGSRLQTRKKGRHTRSGILYPKVPSVRGNAPWYSLRPRPGGDFAIPLLIRERHMIAYTPERTLATNMFYQGHFGARGLAEPGTAILNSVIAQLGLESRGRINIGGRINVYGPELRSLQIPDPRAMAQSALSVIGAAFRPLWLRPVAPVSREVSRADRHALDEAVLDAAGIPLRFAALLREALVERVERRLCRERTMEADASPQGAPAIEHASRKGRGLQRRPALVSANAGTPGIAARRAIL